MSTPTSDEPTCWLTSGEELFWAQPRAARRLGVAAGPDPNRALLVLGIDPPAIGQRFGLGGEDVEEVVVTPVSPRDSVDPLRLPVEVHLLLPSRPWSPQTTRLGRGDLQLVSRARLVSTRSQAEAVERRMRRADGG